MPTIYIDNRAYTVKDGSPSLLDACLSLGFNLPYFCWHPALHSVGACRQCAVKVFKDAADTRGRIVMSCMTPVVDGTRLSIDDPEAVAFRRQVAEWLMTSHPHDCPICDEGGECHLQDMTVMTGHVYRRFRFKKRTHANQDLGPFVNHEMNRCIQCYRCTRFYNDYAGGRDFAVMGWHDHVYFGRSADGRLESEFSGNLVEVCPTGVFTDKTLKKHTTRPWDLRTAPSICVHCGLGCNTIPGERYGKLRRIRARFHHEVNGYFLCDRGRYGYEFVNSDRRLRQPLVRDAAGRLVPATAEEALARAAQILAGGKAIGIGSPRATLETNFALRTLVGPDRFYHGMADREARLMGTMLAALRSGPARTPSLHDVAASDAVLVLGEDVLSTAPMLGLALRQATFQKPFADAARQNIPSWLDAVVREYIQEARGPFFVATPDATRLDGWATAAFRGSPDDVARLGFAVARAIDPSSQGTTTPLPGATAAPFAAVPPVSEGGLSEFEQLTQRIAESLKSADRPVIVSGPGCGNEAVIRAAAAVAWALCRRGKPAHLCFTAPECNSMGAALMSSSGAEPQSLADKPPVAPDVEAAAPAGNDLTAAVEAVRSGAADTVIIAENDLFRRMDPATAEALLAGAKHVIVLDHLATPTTDRAEVVLPAATFAEATGTLVSSEGRAQRSFQVFAAEGDIRAGWRWLGELAAAARDDTTPWPALDAILAAMAKAMPVFKDVPGLAPPAGFRMIDQRIPRQSPRASGRTAEHAHVDVHEPKPPDDPDSPLAFSMEGATGQPPPALIPRYWSPGWNSVQAINKFQIEVGGPLHGGDPGRRLIEPTVVIGPRVEIGPSVTLGASAPSEASDCSGTAQLKSTADFFQPVSPSGTAANGAAVAPTISERTVDGNPWRTVDGNSWLIVPAWHIFGSEELSARSPAIASLVPLPYVAIGAADAARLGVTDGEQVLLSIVAAPGATAAPFAAVPQESPDATSEPDTTASLSASVSGQAHKLVLRIHDKLPAGVATMAVGLPGAPAVDLPAWGEITPAAASDKAPADSHEDDA